MEESKVYIVNYAGYDYSAAMKYGKLVPVTKGTVEIFKEHRMAYDIKQALVDFDPNKDYLLFSGSSIINVVASSIILAKFESYKCLIYGAKRGDYVERTIYRVWPDLLEDEDAKYNNVSALQNRAWDEDNVANRAYAELTSHKIASRKSNGRRNNRN